MSKIYKQTISGEKQPITKKKKERKRKENDKHRVLDTQQKIQSGTVGWSALLRSELRMRRGAPQRILWAQAEAVDVGAY